MALKYATISRSSDYNGADILIFCDHFVNIKIKKRVLA